MLSRFLYYCLLKPLSYLPLSVLYRLSDFIFLVIYYLVGYRRKVVFSNLHNAFPEKTETEITRIAKGFYRHLCDWIVESIRIFSMPREEAVRRVRVLNPKVADRVAATGKPVILTAAHYATWEMATVGFGLQLELEPYVIMAPIKNKFWQKKIVQSRTRFRTRYLKMRGIRSFLSARHPHPVGVVFVGDQAPPDSTGRYYWTTFLNQETPVMLGTERFAKIYDLPVIYMKQQRIKRGYYTLEMIPLTDTPKATETFEITEMHTRLLEEIILDAPRFWLWSHKRWKRKRPVRKEKT